MPDPVSVATGWGERTAADLAGLLVELSRLVKALCFYEAGHDTCRELANRTHRAWQAELTRAGELELQRQGSAISSPGLPEPLDPEPMRDLIAALERHSILTLRFDSELPRETLASFGRLLCEAEGAPGYGFAMRLYAETDAGIEVNGESRPEPLPAPEVNLPSASLGSSLLGGAMASLDPQPTLPAATPNVEGAPHPPAAPAAPSVPSVPGIPGGDAVSDVSILEAPLLAPAYDIRGETLRLALGELDRCAEDERYERYLGEVVELARQLVAAAQVEEGFRASLVLADHAAGQSGSSGAQARMAQAGLEKLVEPTLLHYIMNGVCAPGAAGVRPAQVLLQLGEHCVPAMLQQLDDESDPARSSQLSAVVIALGEHAVPTLLRTIARQSGKRAQLAVRLAGELQSPKLVPTLFSVLQDSGPAMRREAAKALVHIGNSEACDVLVRSLSSKSEDLPRIAALSLGVLGDERAVRPLLRTLERAQRDRQVRLAEEVIRALGEMPGHQDEISRRLETVLEERSIMRRKKQRPCKLVALEVLGGFGSAEARRVIVGATRDPDPTVSDSARAILAQPRSD